MQKSFANILDFFITVGVISFPYRTYALGSSSAIARRSGSGYTSLSSPSIGEVRRGIGEG